MCGYPPDLQDAAVQNVLQQAEMGSVNDWMETVAWPRARSARSSSTPPDASQSLAPKILEPHRCQFGIAHRVLDIFVTKIGLQGASVVPVVR